MPLFRALSWYFENVTRTWNSVLSILLFLALSPLVYSVLWHRRKERGVLVMRPGSIYLSKPKCVVYTIVCAALYIPDFILLRRYFIRSYTQDMLIVLACLLVSVTFMVCLFVWHYKHLDTQ